MTEREVKKEIFKRLVSAAKMVNAPTGQLINAAWWMYIRPNKYNIFVNCISSGMHWMAAYKQVKAL